MQTPGEVQLETGADQDQARRIRSICPDERAQSRRTTPGHYLLPGLHALLHAKSEGQFPSGDADREVTLPAQSCPPTGADADAAALANSGPSSQPQQGDTRSLCLLRHCRELPSSATGISDRGALLAQNAVQPEPQRPHHMGCVPPDQGTDSNYATEAVPSLREATVYRCAVNQLPKSVVREICTLRSVGAGGGRPPPATRCGDGNIPTYSETRG